MPGGLTVDRAARTVTGLAVPYDRTARTGGRRLRFQPGWRVGSGPVQLLRDHDWSQRIGSVDLTELAGGAEARAEVSRGSRGDQALALAADQLLWFSVRVRFLDLRQIPGNLGARLVVAAELLEVTLTANPAFETR